MMGYLIGSEALVVHCFSRGLWDTSVSQHPTRWYLQQPTMSQAPPTSTDLSDALQAVQHREVEGAIPKGCISEDTQTKTVEQSLRNQLPHPADSEAQEPSEGSQLEASPGKWVEPIHPQQRLTHDTPPSYSAT